MLRPIGATILPTTTRPEIEIDEQWSYVGSTGQVVWHWVAVERSTKRVVGWAVDDRSATTCRTLWESLPADYRKRGLFYGARRDEPGGLVPQHLLPVGCQSGAKNLVI